MAETTTATGRRRACSATSRAARATDSAEPTLVPPNFITSREVDIAGTLWMVGPPLVGGSKWPGSATNAAHSGRGIVDLALQVHAVLLELVLVVVPVQRLPLLATFGDLTLLRGDLLLRTLVALGLQHEDVS